MMSIKLKQLKRRICSTKKEIDRRFAAIDNHKNKIEFLKMRLNSLDYEVKQQQLNERQGL
jgi:hypothetical protein